MLVERREWATMTMRCGEYAQWRVCRAIWYDAGPERGIGRYGAVWDAMRDRHTQRTAFSMQHVCQAFDSAVDTALRAQANRSLSAAQLLRRRARALPDPVFQALGELPYLMIALSELEVSRAYRLLRRRVDLLRKAAASDAEVLWLVMAGQAVSLLGASGSGSRWMRRALEILSAAHPDQVCHSVRAAALIATTHHIASQWLRKEGLNGLRAEPELPHEFMSTTTSSRPMDLSLIQPLRSLLELEIERGYLLELDVALYMTRALDHTCPVSDNTSGRRFIQLLATQSALEPKARDLSILVGVGMAVSDDPSSAGKALSAMLEKLSSEQHRLPDELLIAAAVCAARARDLPKSWSYLRLCMALDAEREDIAQTHSWLTYMSQDRALDYGHSSEQELPLTAEKLSAFAKASRLRPSAVDLGNFFGVSTRSVYQYFQSKFGETPRKMLARLMQQECP